MEIGFTEEQEILKNSAREFLERECPRTLVKEMAEDERGYPPQLWQKMAELGWMGLVVPANYGGAGYSFMDLVLLLEEMGRVCLPGPFFSTVALGALPVLLGGSEEQKNKFLPKIAKGELIVTTAWTEASANYEPWAISTQAKPEGDSYIINGTKLFVTDAHVADYIICVCRTKDGGNPEGGITLFLVDAKSPGIKHTLLKTMSFDKQCEVVFDNVKVPRANILGELDNGWDLLQKIQQYAAVVKCADILGAAEVAYEMTISFAKERVQFGKPIGSFQAVQHHCVDMAVDVEGIKYFTYEAAWMLGEGLPATKLVSMAKAWASEASYRVTFWTHEIHGTISFCIDSDVHLFHRRCKVDSLFFGDSTFHQKAIAGELLKEEIIVKELSKAARSR